MADAKRWSVTYTKHVKQKRKVYQDGLLELRASTNKLLLYDSCEKLLECRILKNGEIVSCGETLKFNAFLVDVNDAEGHHEPPATSNLLGKWSQSGSDKSKSRKLNLSPSHQIIRDFKKREILKYTVLQNKSPDAAKSSVTEYEVMYTTQLTQKAKKFHDGFLQLSLRGSTGRQVVLFDESRNSVARSFLKKDDKIASGVRIIFDGHLVEIRESQENLKSSEDNKCNVVEEKGVMQRQDNYACRNPLQKESIKTEVQKNRESCSSQETKEAEWQVLYTTQLTQKSKKYHDGFLQLAICGSRGREAKLYDENRTILHRGFLKKEEVIGTGVSLKFDAYLIDIVNPEGNSGIDPTVLESNPKMVNKEKVDIQQNLLRSKQDNKGPIKSDQANKPLRNEWQVLYTTQLTQKTKKYHDGFLRLETCGSRGREAKLYDESKTILHRGFLKNDEVIETGISLKFDAYLIDIGYPEGKSEIDSTCTESNPKIVNKEKARKKTILHRGILKKEDVIETGTSLKFDAKSIGIENHEGKRGVDSVATESNSETVNKEKVHLQKNLLTSNSYIIKGKSLTASGSRIYANSNLSITEQEMKGPTGTDPPNKPLRDARQILSILQKPKPSNSPAVDYMASSTKGNLESDDVNLDFSENAQLLMSPHDEARKTADITESRESSDLERSPHTLSSTEMLDGSGSQLPMDIDIENLNEKLCSETEVDDKSRDGENSMEFPFFTAPCGVVDDAVNPSPASKALPDFPSFDLGFF